MYVCACTYSHLPSVGTQPRIVTSPIPPFSLSLFLSLTHGSTSSASSYIRARAPASLIYVTEPRSILSSLMTSCGASYVCSAVAKEWGGGVVRHVGRSPGRDGAIGPGGQTQRGGTKIVNQRARAPN